MAQANRLRCGKEFTSRAYTIKSGKSRFCSKSCANKNQAELILIQKPPVRVEGDIAFIPLTRGKWAKVDRADYETIPELKENWCAVPLPKSKIFYAAKANGVGNSMITMHRLIMKPPDDMDVDHVDFDGLNNTRENLRVCTSLRNFQHRRKPTRDGKPIGSSRYKGVSNVRGRWKAMVAGNYLGYFATEEEAAAAYNAAAREHFGEYALLNIIESDR